MSSDFTATIPEPPSPTLSPSPSPASLPSPSSTAKNTTVVPKNSTDSSVGYKFPGGTQAQGSIPTGDSSSSSTPALPPLAIMGIVIGGVLLMGVIMLLYLRMSSKQSKRLQKSQAISIHDMPMSYNVPKLGSDPVESKANGTMRVFVPDRNTYY